MGAMPVPELLLNMSVPIMVSLLVQSLYNIVDSIFVARISESALTATTLAYPVQILMVAVAIGTGSGMASLLSRMLGSGDRRGACMCATTGIMLTVLSAFVFLLLGIFAVNGFVRLFTDDAETAQMCVIYLRICMLFGIGTFVEVVVQRILQAVGNTFLSMVSLAAGALTNIILDPIFIFGLLGIPAFGIAGAAMATVIGQWVGAIVALMLNKFRNKDVRFIFRGFRPDMKMIGEIYKVGIPTMVMQGMASIMNAAMNAILISFSSTAVAFFGVYFKLQNFLYMPINGIGQAVLPIVGYNYGGRSKERLAKLLKTAIPATVAIALCGTVLFCTVPGPLLSLFSASEEMLALGIPAIRIISLSFAFGGVVVVLGFYAAGLGNGVINMLGTAIRQFIVLIPAVLIIANTAGISRIWYAFWISESAALICTVLMFTHTYKKKLREISA